MCGIRIKMEHKLFCIRKHAKDFNMLFASPITDAQHANWITSSRSHDLQMMRMESLLLTLEFDVRKSSVGDAINKMNIQTYMWMNCVHCILVYIILSLNFLNVHTGIFICKISHYHNVILYTLDLFLTSFIYFQDTINYWTVTLLKFICHWLRYKHLLNFN